MTERTIKQVSTFNLEREYTEDQFVDMWVSHACELRKIVHVERLHSLIDEIKRAAAETFEEIWVNQQAQKETK